MNFVNQETNMCQLINWKSKTCHLVKCQMLLSIHEGPRCLQLSKIWGPFGGQLPVLLFMEDILGKIGEFLVIPMQNETKFSKEQLQHLDFVGKDFEVLVPNVLAKFERE